MSQRFYVFFRGDAGWRLKKRCQTLNEALEAYLALKVDPEMGQKTLVELADDGKQYILQASGSHTWESTVKVVRRNTTLEKDE